MKKVGELFGISIFTSPLVPEDKLYLLSDDIKWKYKYLNKDRYKGKGRPRKSDYDYLNHPKFEWII